MNQTLPSIPSSEQVSSKVIPQSRAKLQNKVTYYSGMTTYSQEYALLEWTEDDHIRLSKTGIGKLPRQDQLDLILQPGSVTLDQHDTDQTQELIFETTVEKIEKVSGWLGMVIFRINGEKYRVDFTPGLTGQLGTPWPGAALLSSSEVTTKAGLQVWLAALRSSQVKVSHWSAGKLVGMTVLAVVGITILAGIASAIYLFG